MIADILMDLFDSELPADSISSDPLVTPEETFSDQDPFVMLSQEHSGDIDDNLTDILSGDVNSDLVSTEPDVIGNERADSADLDVAGNADADSGEDLPSSSESDVADSDGSGTEGTEPMLDTTEVNEIVGLTDLAEASPNDDSVPTPGENVGKSLLDPVFDFASDIWERFFQPFFDPGDIVRASDFSSDGSMDTKNNLVVVGDVASDINFISQQTHGSCSLMAQEQFVHRLTGQPMPEEYLEWQAEKWGVYHPDIGTVSEGQEMVLEHFNIPYDRDYNPDMDDIVRSMSKGNDVLISVDAREFYQDPSIPPGAGHAVALVGRGLDPETGDLKGFYVTDSNFPGAAHFIPTEQMEASWFGNDMISVPENLAA